MAYNKDQEDNTSNNHQMECCDSPLKDNISIASTASMSQSDSNSISDQSLSSCNLHRNGSCYCNACYCNADKNLSIQNKSIKPIGRVTFASTIKVCLIPSRREFGTLSPFLWWTLNECRTFKSEAFVEVREHVAKYGCTVKEAMFTLYQPIHEDDNVNDIDNGINYASTSLQMDEEWLQSTLHSIFDKWNPVDFQPTSPSLPQSSSSPSLTSLCSNNSHQHHQKQQRQHYFTDTSHNKNNSNNVVDDRFVGDNKNRCNDDYNHVNVVDQLNAIAPADKIMNSIIAATEATEVASIQFLCGNNDHAYAQSQSIMVECDSRSDCLLVSLCKINR